MKRIKEGGRERDREWERLKRKPTREIYIFWSKTSPNNFLLADESARERERESFKKR